jgi:hypothetical protein
MEILIAARENEGGALHRHYCDECGDYYFCRGKKCAPVQNVNCPRHEHLTRFNAIADDQTA